MAGIASLLNRHKVLAISFGLAIMVILSFWQVIYSDFLIYDDWEYVVTNDVVRRGLTAESVTWAFQRFHTSNWHPVTWISHMVDVEFYGLRPMGHHITNLILHTLNTLLVFGFLKRLTGSLWRSALVAALFGLHPTHVESVAWVAERKDVLSTFFGLLSLISYSQYARVSHSLSVHPSYSRLGFLRSPGYWLTGLFLALGLMSKPMLVTWPFVMLLLDWWPLNRISIQPQVSNLEPWKRISELIFEKLPFIVLTVGSCTLTFLAQRTGGAVQSLEQLSASARFGNAIISCARYLGKTFWPTDLSVYYPYPVAWSVWAIVGAALLLGTLLAVTMLGIRQHPYALFGLLWFLGTLVPVTGLVQVGGQSIADRYLYVPQIGLFIAIAWLVGELVHRWASLRQPLAGLALLSLLACLLLTRTRVRDWQNSETLFTQALQVTQGNFIAHNNLGLYYLQKKKYDLAIRSFQAALVIRPEYAATHSNLGLALAALNKTNEAIAQIVEALRFQPTLQEARVNLASLYISQRRFPEALELLEVAVREAPSYPEGQYTLANVLAEQGRLDEATQYVKAALQLRPDYAEAMSCLGTIYLKQGKFKEAVLNYRAALVCNPEFAEAQCNLGLVSAAQANYLEAVSEYEAALILNPDLLPAHLGLAIVLEHLGRLAEGAEHWAAALKLSPNLWGAHEQMGVLLVKQGKMPEALPHFAEAVIVQPDNHRLRAQYGLVLDQMGEIKLALGEYRRAIELDPNQPEVLNNLSWILATSADGSLRNGEEAVRLGQKACELTTNRDARFVGTLAAALAEAGRYEDAIRTGERARDLARQAGLEEIAARNEELLNLYRSGRPYRERFTVGP